VRTIYLKYTEHGFTFSSLERIETYVQIEQEEKPSESGIPPAYWPADGSLHVENLSARYSADGPKVLHGISFDVKSGERVGIVGRTGSGKVRGSEWPRPPMLNINRAPSLSPCCDASSRREASSTPAKIQAR
jgi:hypothetical protein